MIEVIRMNNVVILRDGDDEVELQYHQVPELIERLYGVMQ